MSRRDWLSNRREERHVAAQAVLMSAALFAPILDRRFGTGIALASGTALCLTGLAFVVIGSIRLGRSLSPFPKPRDEGALLHYAIVRSRRRRSSVRRLKTGRRPSVAG